MKIEFITLWVDDQIDFADSIKMQLEDWLEEKGFELTVLMHKNADKVLENIKCKDVELIIIDYRLPGKNGDSLIEEIRQGGFYHDIIFYSEGALPEKRLDGVFFVSKQDARTRIKELIEFKLKRSSDPISIRGWIVADSIELEGMVTELLAQCFVEKESLTFSERLLGHDSPLEFAKKHTLLNGILKDLVKSLNAQGLQDEQRTIELRTCKSIFNDFVKEVIHIRNAIAHQKVEDLGTGKIIKMRTTKITLNEVSFTKMRRDLRKHRDNLVTLQHLILSNQV